jgi:hypothetical protein
MPPPIVSQVADVDTRLRMDRQDALLEQILARLNTASPPSTKTSALLAPANFAVNGTATTIAQMVAAVPPPMTMTLTMTLLPRMNWMIAPEYPSCLWGAYRVV